MPSAAPEPSLTPNPPLVERFRTDLARLSPLGPDERLGVAVSGGPDSLALLLLAHAAFPGRVEAATVDHGLRMASAAEAAVVAGVCASLKVPHATLKSRWDHDTKEGLQAAARAYRYAELRGWCARNRLALLATAHHADDQAETVMMRLARGAGVGGLAGIRASRHLGALTLVRPLLRFTKAELVAIVASTGLDAADDPSNAEARFDRTHARRLLGETNWLDPARLAASASHLADADAALGWAARAERQRRVTHTDENAEWSFDHAELPDEILRRILSELIVEYHAAGSHKGQEPRGPDLTRLIARLRAGQTATLGHVLVRPGPVWRINMAPARRP